MTGNDLKMHKNSTLYFWTMENFISVYFHFLTFNHHLLSYTHVHVQSIQQLVRVIKKFLQHISYFDCFVKGYKKFSFVIFNLLSWWNIVRMKSSPTINATHYPVLVLPVIFLSCLFSIFEVFPPSLSSHHLLIIIIFPD